MTDRHCTHPPPLPPSPLASLPRQHREPFQYLIATAHWREHVLAVSPGVLIPRPETEIFPDLVARAVRERPALALHPWADLGTGSGAIAIGAATELRRHNKVCEGGMLREAGRLPSELRRSSDGTIRRGGESKLKWVAGQGCENLASARWT